jgi:hypothetical protein
MSNGRVRETAAVAGALAARRVNSRGGDTSGGFVMFSAFPLLAIPVVIYNFFAVTMMAGSKAGGFADAWNHTLFNVPMPRNAQWSVSGGDLLVLLALVMLFFELLKATNNNKIAIINHSLSMVLFVICLVEFLLIPAFATSPFFLITVMTVLDVLAGFIVTIVASRKEVEFNN